MWPASHSLRLAALLATATSLDFGEIGPFVKEASGGRLMDFMQSFKWLPDLGSCSKAPPHHMGAAEVGL